MKNVLRLTFGLFVVWALAGLSGPVQAQTTSNGPYYATPSWDQTLPSATRFIILSNFNSGAVLDRETGLVWEKSPSQDFFVWLTAQRHCNTLVVGTRTGWRLPTLQELTSLADTSRSPALPSGHPFSNVEGPSFWSATTSATNTNDAWGARFADFIIDTIEKGPTAIHAWCVRGGQGVDPQ